MVVHRPPRRAHPAGARHAASEPLASLSEARWQRLWRLITQLDQPPTPLPLATARALVQALLYRALTGVAWDALPAWAPPAVEVEATYQRWQQQGLLAQLSDELRVCLTLDDPAR